MRRWAFNILAALSMVLCLGMLALWLISCWIGCAMSYDSSPDEDGWYASLGAGIDINSLVIDYASNDLPWRSPGFYMRTWNHPPSQPWTTGLWFRYEVLDFWGPDRRLQVPFWSLALLFAIAPALWFRRSRRLRRRHAPFARRR